MSPEERESPRWAMLADDLTGACDAGVAFALAGYRTSVVWREEAGWPAEPEVLAVSTETRAAGEEEAAEKVRRICASLGRPIVYKKIDSVLRGPIQAEIEAVVEAGGFQRVVACPALPEQGRTVRNGRLLLNGEPLDGRPEGLHLVDAGTAEDLRSLGEGLANEVGETLAVGSAGLALALALALGGKWEPRPLPACERPVAVVIGSHHPVTLAQLDYLRGAGTIPETTAQGFETIARDSFAAIVMREVDETAFEPLGRAIDAGRIGGLVVTGGATARVMLDGLGAAGIDLCGELERGVPWGRVRGGKAGGVPILTKSGGFGSPDCLWRAWRALRPETKA